MSPTIVLGPGGQPIIVTGSPGGSRIIPYVTKALVAMIDWKLDPAEAAALPNLATVNNSLAFEPRGATILDALHYPGEWLRMLDIMINLRGLGQDVRLEAMTSGIHTIRRRPDGALEGGADPRREGQAVGD